MHGVDFNAVDPGLLRIEGALGEIMDIAVDLLFRDAGIFLRGVPHILNLGRCGLRSADARAAREGRHLHEDFRTVTVDPFSQVLLVFDIGFGAVHDAGQPGPQGNDGDEPRDDEAGAPLGAFDIIVGAVFCVASVRVHQPGRKHAHRHHCNPVFDFHGSDPDGLKQVLESACHRNHPLFNE